ncbi:cell division protein FtsX [Streptosporangium album]|uniref:Cell division protein FtsX n=1 Tax=Streptosporangium album TaxID=47479 RepID=A0A7W7RVF6_9ACTN|nr:permease-like cell division protein FtsX [Streptosporangium album]MBB4938677.1 cell division protein FtsX [Streptosporangium album]
MNATENRLREALSAAAATAADVRPLTAPARRRSRAPLRIGAVVLAVAVTAFGAVRLTVPSPVLRGETIVAMSMSGVEPSGMAGVSVFLCKKSDPFPHCKDREISTEDRENLLRMLEGRPEAEAVTFESRQQAWEKFQREYQDNPELLKAITPRDMPESFRVRIRPDADSMAVAQAAGELPGVSNAIDTACLYEQRASLMSIIMSKLPWAEDRKQCSYPEHPELTGSG